MNLWLSQEDSLTDKERVQVLGTDTVEAFRLFYVLYEYVEMRETE